MTEAAVEELLVEGINEIQKVTGVKPPNVTGATIPIGGLPCFDSLNAVEVLTSVEAKIEAKIGREVEIDVSVFFTDQGRSKLKKGMTYRSQTVSEIAKNICKRIRKGK